MALKTRVSKWGSSLAVRIPKAIAEEWGVEEGTQIELTRDGNGVNLRKHEYDLDEMIASIDPDNLPPYLWDDQPRGKEVW